MLAKGTERKQQKRANGERTCSNATKYHSKSYENTKNKRLAAVLGRWTEANRGNVRIRVFGQVVSHHLQIWALCVNAKRTPEIREIPLLEN